MATVYSSEVAIGSYNRIRIKCDYSGTSASLTIQFRRTSSYTTTWADSGARLIFNGQDKAANYSYTGTVSTSWVDLRSAVTGYTISAAGGTYNWQFTNPVGGVLACSGTITIPSQGSDPTGLSLSSVSAGPDWVKGTVAVTDWGGLGDSTTRYRNLSVCKSSYKPDSERRYQRVYGNTLSSAITVNNSTEYGTMTIVPNTKYWLWWYATNGTYGVESPTTSTTTVYTTAKAPTVSVKSVTTTTAVINYSTTADGGAYSKSIQYSLDGSTWKTGATVSSASATSGTYTITGLTPKTTYSIRTRVSTTAGTTTGSTLSATTLTDAKLYGSVSGKTKLVTKLYGSVGGKAKVITKLYGSVGGKAKLIYRA